MSTSDSKSPRNFIASHLNQVGRSGIRDFFDIVTSMDDVISLGVGEPDFTTPWHVREASVFALERGATSYTSNLGLPKLRAAITRYLGQHYGVEYDSSREVLITVGVSEALDLAIRCITEPGDEIIYHEPCYVSYAPLITFAHGKPVAIETDERTGFRITRESLEAAITDKSKALILNYPNNPTGGALEADDIPWIAELAIKHDLLVITDEIYSELTYDNEHPSLVSIPGMKERTIFLHGFSKALAMTGFRIGYACAPNELIEAMCKIHQYTMLCAPILSQEAALEALRDPEKDIAEMKSSYHKRRNFMHARFTEMGIPCPMPKGAFYAFPNISAYGLSSKDFAMRFLEEEKVAVVPGPAFGACGEGHVRCCYATSMDELRIAMDRLEAFTQRLRQEQGSASNPNPDMEKLNIS